MIVYFSGTGNSRAVAHYLADQTGDNLLSMHDLKTPLKGGDSLGIICPVYAWDAPEYFYKILSTGLLGQNWEYVYAVVTYGENMGLTLENMQKALRGSGLDLKLGYGIQMPNNYIIFGDIDSSSEQKKKITKAFKQIDGIANEVLSKASKAFVGNKGKFPFMLSHVFNPLFLKFGRQAKSFHSTSNCIHCGFCEAICPEKNIALIEGRPTWGKSCQLCLACIHRCPVRAIEYGKSTLSKGRYYLADSLVKEIIQEYKDKTI